MQKDCVSEWLRRSAANRLGFARAGSNPATVAALVA